MILEYYTIQLLYFLCLENADAKQDPKAVALYNFMASSLFLLITALLVDVLCVIGILSVTFQKDSVSLSDIRSSVDTKGTLETMKQGSRNVDLILESLDDGEQSTSGKSLVKGVEIQDDKQLRDQFISIRNRYIDNLSEKISDRFPQDDVDILK